MQHVQIFQGTDGWQGAHERKKLKNLKEKNLKIDRVIKNHKTNNRLISNKNSHHGEAKRRSWSWWWSWWW
jgi:hypothetical protein